MGNLNITSKVMPYPPAVFFFFPRCLVDRFCHCFVSVPSVWLIVFVSVPTLDSFILLNSTSAKFS